jgi:hypothetical protein
LINRQFISNILSVFLAVIFLVSLPAPFASGQAEGSGLEVNARPAFDGFFKYGEWLPIWVQLENRGRDLEVEVRVRISDGWGGTNYVASVDLPTGSRKRVPLYVLPNSFTHEMVVQVYAKNNLLASQNVSVKPQPNIHYVVGFIAPQAGAMSMIKGIDLPGQARPVVMVNLPLSDIPERVEALRTFDAIILNDIDTSPLTPAQRAVLETWVLQGGRLVIGGGGQAMRTVSGLPESLLPLIPRQVSEVDRLAGLATFADDQEVRVPGPFTLAGGELLEGRTLLEDNGMPLIRERPVGKGAVDFIALDLAASPFDAWSGTAAFWKTLLSPGASYPEWMPFDMSFRQRRASSMIWALSNMPALDLPSVRSLAILLGVYILLVGPVNYLVLRWRKRLHLAWLTIPAVTILFSASAFGLGYAMRGTDVILNKIAVVEVGSDGNASVSSYLGLFSPAQQSYEIEVYGDGLISPMRADYDPWGGPGGPGISNEASFVQGNPGKVRGLSVNQWSMQSFMTEGTWPGFGQITADLSLNNQSLIGTIRNDTDYTFTDTVLILGSRFQRMGTFDPGEQKTVQFELPSLVGHPFESSIAYQLFQDQMDYSRPDGPDRQIQLKQAVVESVFPWGNYSGPIMGANTPLVDPLNSFQILMLGWFEQAPPEVQISGRMPALKTTALLFTSLPFDIEQGDRVALIPGLIPGRVTEMPVDGGLCGSSGSPAVYFGRGDAVLEYQIPEYALDVEIERLLLYIGTEGGWDRTPQTAVYDWSNASWGELPEVRVGQNLVGDAQKLVSEEGLIRVRLSANAFAGGCFFVAMGLEGTR